MDYGTTIIEAGKKGHPQIMISELPVPAEEIRLRIGAAQNELCRKEINALLIMQRADLYYFSGTAQNGFLYIPSEGPPLLLIKKYMPRALQESPIEDILEINSVKEVPARISEFYGYEPFSLALELDVIPVREFMFYRELFKNQNCIDGSSLIKGLRMIKSDWEIERLRNTARMSSRTFEFIRNKLAPGYTEMEFAGMFETFARRLGHGGRVRVRDFQSEGYPWHVLSGRSGGMVGLLDSPATGEGTSPAFPCGAGHKELAPHEPIMIDLASILDGYHADETRMFAIGSMPKKALRASQAAIEIHNHVLEMIRPGVRVDELFQASVDKADSLGYAESFLGPPGYKVTFIGHGMGLELIEPPIIAANKSQKLQPGMVLAIEPKMVFENEFCAGIESNVVVTHTGCSLLSEVPAEVFVCPE